MDARPLKPLSIRQLDRCRYDGEIFPDYKAGAICRHGHGSRVFQCNKLRRKIRQTSVRLFWLPISIPCLLRGISRQLRMASAETPIPEAGPEQGRVQVSVYSRFKPLQKRGITAIGSPPTRRLPPSSTSAMPSTWQSWASLPLSGGRGPISSVADPFVTSFPLARVFLTSITGLPLELDVFPGLFTIGTALAPMLQLFFLFRAFPAFQGAAFLILGSACISDIYHPYGLPSKKLDITLTRSTIDGASNVAWPVFVGNCCRSCLRPGPRWH